MPDAEAAGAREAPPAEAVALVLVHRDQPERLLASVAAFAVDRVPLRVVVVDNGSTGPALARLSAALPDGAVLVRLGANTGFGPGANAGLVWALERGHDLVAVAPHDALPHPGALRALVEELRARPRAGLVSADVGDGRRPHLDPYFGGITLPRATESGWERCDYPHGTLFVARAGCLREVGLFDERYFAYGEEADLGHRVRRAGWEVGIVHGARVVNPELGGTSASVDYLMSRNTLLLVREHFGRYRAAVRATIMVAQLVRGVVQPTARPWVFSARGRAWALVDHARRRYGPPPDRLLPRPPPRPGAGTARDAADDCRRS